MAVTVFPWIRNLTIITSVHSADIGMSTYQYFNDPVTGYINSTPVNMETNQEINNSSVNETSVDNRRSSPSSQVYPEKQDGLVEGQGPDGCHQATDRNARQEDVAEMEPKQHLLFVLEKLRNYCLNLILMWHWT